MPADTVISYWKPEVAVRLVTDFTKYPLDYGTLVQLVPHFTIACPPVPYAINPHVINPKLRQGLTASQRATASPQQV